MPIRNNKFRHFNYILILGDIRRNNRYPVDPAGTELKNTQDFFFAVFNDVGDICIVNSILRKHK